MAIIRVLDKYTADRIAAGEVVERPASVVKEFVENSLDAGAKSISVEIQNGGLGSIKVIDDGCGIEHGQVKTAFLRHATSKIASSDDLACIETLGFRGEALSSIAAVSRVSMRTKTASAQTGSYIRAEGGDVVDFSETGAPDGTSIEAADLFYNVPARLKFIKSARAEAASIGDYVSRMIMARPDVAFTLTQNDKAVYRSAGDGELKNAMFCIYGADIMPHIKAVYFDDGYVSVSGYIGTEAIGRANRTAQSFYVNGRYIRSQKLSFALQRAYETRLMTGKFPFCVIAVSLNSSEMDVNVHPNKLDVRFRQEERIVRAVYSAAKAALNSDAQTLLSSGTPEAHNKPHIEPVVYHAQGVSYDFSRTDGKLKLEALSREAFDSRPVEGLKLHDIAVSGTAGPAIHIDVQPAVIDIAESTPCQQALHDEYIDLAGVSIIGQLFGCYWVVQRESRVFFIDQHAAHERRLYEEIQKRGVNADSQLLLVPETVRLTPYEFDTLITNLPAFEELGFDISEFGPLTVSVRAVPSILGAPQTTAFLMEAIAQLDRKYKLNTAELKRSVLIRTACKHAIKAGEKPDKLEIASLLDCYEREGVPLTCPHGRPVMICMTQLEFEKLFKRVL